MAVNWVHGIIPTMAAIEEIVWVHGPAATRACGPETIGDSAKATSHVVVRGSFCSDAMSVRVPCTVTWNQGNVQDGLLTRVYINVRGPCCHQKPHKCLGSEL